MAKEIDNRIVEMEFKNKDFEKAIAVTMDSLDELNEKLDKLNDINVKGFDDLAKSANSINFDKLISSIDYIKDRFGLIGIAAQQLKTKIVDEMFEAAASIGRAFDSVTDIVKEKGSARAMNIAQAKFQLSNLGIEWEKIKGSIDQAVNDTRFGMDEAAMAASQLVASGVKLGEDMDHALLGISGVAAMTNSEYSDIAHIFTSIAGIGKVYRQQLNQIAGRGLNATAAIAKYMGITESEVNEILQDKDAFIDFTTFAEAMWASYGDAAKKGNDLFTGALSNAKAALGRIGEKFYTPFYEYARQVLVAVKPVINDINKSLTPLFNSLDYLMSNGKDVIVSFLEGYAEGFNFFGYELNFKNIVDSVIGWAAEIVDGLGGFFSEGNGTLSNIVEIISNIFWNIWSVVMTVKDAIVDVFGEFGRGNVVYAIQAIRDFTERTKLSETQLDNIGRTIRGVASAFDILGKVVDAVYRVFLKPLLSIFFDLGGEAMGFTATLGDMIYNFDQGLDIFGPLSNWFEKLKYNVSNLAATFQDVTGIDFKSLFAGFKEGLNTIGDVAALVGGGIIGVFIGIAGAIGTAIEQIGIFISALESEGTFKEYLNNLVKQSTILTWIKDTIEKIKTSVKQLINGEITFSQFLGLDKLKEKFEWLMPIIEKFKEHYKSIFEAETQGVVPEGGFIDQFGKKLKDAIMNMDFTEVWGAIGAGFYMWLAKKKLDIEKYLADTFSSFTGAFQKFTEGINMSLVKLQKETNADKILKIAAAVGILALSIVALAHVDNAGLEKALTALLLIMAMLGLVIALLSHAVEKTTEVDKKSKILDTNVRDKTKSKTSGKGKNKNVISTIFEKVATRCTEIEETIKEKISDISGLPALILSFAAAVWLIVSAVAKLANIGAIGPAGIDALEAGLAIVLSVMGVLALLIALMVGMLDTVKKNDTWDDDALLKLAAMTLSIGLAVKMIANAILLFALVPEDRMAQVITAAGVMMLFMTLMAALYILMNEATTSMKDPNMPIKMGVMFVLMAAALSMLTLPLVAIGVLATFSPFGLIAAFATLTILLAEMTLIALAFGALFGEMPSAIPAMLAGAASMVIMAFAIDMLMIPIAAIMGLGELDYEMLWDAVTIVNILAIVFGLLVVAFGAIGAASGGLAAVGMLAAAVSMLLIAEALTKLMIPLAAIGLMQQNGLLEDALVGIAEGLKLIGIASLAAIPLSTGLLMFIAVIVSLAGAIALLGAGVFLAGTGILSFIIALEKLANIDLSNISDNAKNIGDALIEGFFKAIVDGIPTIKEGMLVLLGGLVDTIKGSAGMIAEAAIVLLTDVIIAIDKNALKLGYHLGHALGDIIKAALAGLAGSGYDFFARLLGKEGGLSDALEYMLFDGEDQKSVFDMFGGLFKGDDAKKAVTDGAAETGKEGADVMASETAKELGSSKNQDLMANAVGSFMNSGFDINNMDLTSITNTGGEVGGTFTTGVNDQLASAGEDGNNYVGGLIQSVTSSQNISDLYNAGGIVGGSLKSGTQDKLEVASPSKVAIRIGEYFNEGLLIGIGDGSEISEKASENASSIISSVQDVMESPEMSELAASMATIGLTSDSDYTPTITPILDLSGVNQGFNELNSMFASQRSLALAGEASYLQDSNRALSMELQNGNTNVMNNGLNALGSKLDRLGEAIINRQIYLDSGELVGGLADPMDRTLGVRTIMVQRGGRRG